MRYLVRLATRGGVAAFLLVSFGFLFVVPYPAHAQEEHLVERPWITLETFTVLILALGAGSVVCFGTGVSKARKEDAWPHWRALLMGLGEAAFLLGVIGAFQGLGEAFGVVASLGAAVTPSDVADGYALSVERLLLGAWIALAALIGAGILGWLQPPRRGPERAGTAG